MVGGEGVGDIFDGFIARLRDLLLIYPKTWRPLKSYTWPNMTQPTYYKFDYIFICFHKAFHDRLPVPLIDCITN